MVFSFLPKNVHLLKKKNAILCLFLKNFSHSKRMVCFILNNAHLAMVKGIKFYALNKSRVQIIACKANDFFVCLFIRLPDEIWEKGRNKMLILKQVQFFESLLVPKCYGVFFSTKKKRCIFLKKKCNFLFVS